MIIISVIIITKMLSKVLRIGVCIGSFLYTFYVLCTLTYFLSKPTEHIENNKLLEDGIILKTIWTLFINTTLISGFILQHSLMASDYIKDFYHKYNLDDIERSIYNLCSAGTLHYLIFNWECTTWASVWNFTSIESNKLWFVVSIFHVFGWFIIYMGCVMMDISELAGIKQVYYKLSGRPRPMAIKSRELQRYFMHMRHPSFIGFLIILWIHPIMSLDRLLMASLLSSYMALMWTIDQDDYNYHSLIIARKERELKYN